MGERSFYLLAYDISDDKRRARLAKWMEAVGDRVQNSVFEAWLTSAELEKLLAKAHKRLKKEEDSLRVYSLCDPCRKKVQHWGVVKTVAVPGVKIV